MKKANEWTRDTLTKIGLENAHLEDWGEFGLGWQQLNTWARMVTPDTAVLIRAGDAMVATRPAGAGQRAMWRVSLQHPERKGF